MKNVSGKMFRCSIYQKYKGTYKPNAIPFSPFTVYCFMRTELHLEGHELFMYAYLYSLAVKESLICCIDIKTISAVLGLSRTSSYNVLNSLETKKYITILDTSEDREDKRVHLWKICVFVPNNVNFL